MKKRTFGIRLLPFCAFNLILIATPDDGGWPAFTGRTALMAVAAFFAFTKPAATVTDGQERRLPDYDRIAELERDLGYTPSPRASKPYDASRPPMETKRGRPSGSAPSSTG